MADKTESTGKARTAGTKTAGAKPAAKKVAAPKAAPKTAAAPKAAKVGGGPRLKITQVGSPIGRKHDQRVTLRALGLNKINRSREIDDTSSNRGMVRKVGHLLRVEPVR
jgi:large subunit ribosomal protein L30